MKLSELFEGDQNAITTLLQREQEEWDDSAHWWKEDKKGDAQDQMRKWFSAFQVFKTSVEMDDCLEDSISTWVGLPWAEVNIHEVNVPQMRVWEAYTSAKWRKQQSLEVAMAEETPIPI